MALPLESYGRSHGEHAHPSFDVQFRQKYILEVDRERVKYTRLEPPQPKSDVPVVVAHGYTENHELLQRLLRGLYDDGRIVYMANHGHASPQEQKVTTIASLIDRAVYEAPAEIAKVDLIGRSDGGVNATFAAARQPDKVANLILLDTKHTAPMSTQELTMHGASHILSEAFDAFTHPRSNMHVIKGIEQASRYVATGLGHSIHELDEHAQSDIRGMLPKLRELGIGVFGVHGTADQMFPLADAQRDIARAGGNQQDHQKLFDGFYTAGNKAYERKYGKITHASIYKDPRYVGLVSHAVAAARARSERLAEQPKLEFVHSAEQTLIFGAKSDLTVVNIHDVMQEEHSSVGFANEDGTISMLGEPEDDWDLGEERAL